MPRIVSLSLVDAFGAHNGLQLLAKGMVGRGSWQEVAAAEPMLRRTVVEDDQLGKWRWSDQDPVWPQTQLEFAVFDPAIGDAQFSVGERTPDGLLCGKDGAIEIRKAGCDVTFSLSNDGPDGTARHRAFTGYVAEISRHLNISRAPREMIGGAVQCVWVYTMRLAYWSFGGFLYAKPYIANYQGAILRPLAADQRFGRYTHALHASQMGRMAVFVMQWGGGQWSTPRKMVQINDDYETASATYLLQPDDIVCMVSGSATQWVRQKVDKGEAFASTYTNDPYATVQTVRDGIRAAHGNDPAIVFSVPLV